MREGEGEGGERAGKECMGRMKMGLEREKGVERD